MTTIDMILTGFSVLAGVAAGGWFASRRYAEAMRSVNEARPRFLAWRDHRYENLGVAAAFVGGFFSMRAARDQVLKSLGAGGPEEAFIYDTHRNEWTSFASSPGEPISEAVNGDVVGMMRRG